MDILALTLLLKGLTANPPPSSWGIHPLETSPVLEQSSLPSNSTLWPWLPLLCMFSIASLTVTNYKLLKNTPSTLIMGEEQNALCQLSDTCPGEPFSPGEWSPLVCQSKIIKAQSSHQPWTSQGGMEEKVVRKEVNLCCLQWWRQMYWLDLKGCKRKGLFSVEQTIRIKNIPFLLSSPRALLT